MTQPFEAKRGILNPQALNRKFSLTRRLPSADTAFFIDWYWFVCWDLTGQEPHLQEIIPYPSVNLVFQQCESGIFGVVTRKFTRLLENKGSAFALKFRPGAFYPFAKTSMSQLTDNSVRLETVFGAEINVLEKAILSTENMDEMVALAENFLCGRLPAHDENVVLINQIVDCIMDDRTITKVDDLADRIGINKRKLQRLFRRYVGVSPKWVIQRYRLHEAADQLSDGGEIDLTQMALDLGYFDQAHFIKDFKTIVGTTPTEYAKRTEHG